MQTFPLQRKRNTSFIKFGSVFKWRHRMDNSLIKSFREEVNDQDLILQMYHNRDGKAGWNIICSAMDWIDVVVDEIDIHKLSRGNTNKSSISFMTFITCVDILWEAVQQLNRVFFNTDNVPFSDDSSIFKHKLFQATDNEYFKTIRACFAAHPINLNDKFGGTGEKERRYASWSGGGFGDGDFSVILYSNRADKEPIRLGIYFDELIDFAQKRYDYLHTITDEISRQKKTYLDNWQSKIISKSNNPLSQIEILIQEVSCRYYSHDYYSYLLKKLQIIFSTTITAPKNKVLVEKYRNALVAEIEEIYTNLQNMICEELRSEQFINDSCHPSCRYIFSKLSNAIYDSGYFPLISAEAFQPHLHKFADLSQVMSMEELYTVVCAGFFAINTNHYR